jgi:hypothetical protein
MYDSPKSEIQTEDNISVEPHVNVIDPAVQVPGSDHAPKPLVFEVPIFLELAPPNAGDTD